MSLRATHFLRLLLALLLVLVAGTALAQDPLQETYTSLNGSLAFNYPTGWFVDETAAGVITITNQETLLEEGGTNPLTHQEAALVIFAPTVFTPALQEADAPMENVSDVIGFIRDDLELTTDDVTEAAQITTQAEVVLNEKPAAYLVVLEGETEIMMLVMQMETGDYTLMVLYTGLGGFEEQRETVLEIAKSFVYSPSEEFPIAELEFDTAAFPAPVAGTDGIGWQLQTEGLSTTNTFVQPQSLAIGANDTIYVADTFHGVIVISPEGSVERLLTTPDVTGVSAALAGGEGSLWVLDALGYNIYRMNDDGVIQATINPDEVDEILSLEKLTEGQMAVGPDGNLYLYNEYYESAEEGQAQLLVFGQDGALQRTISLEDATLTPLTHLAIAPDGTLYLMDSLGDLDVLDSDGNLLEDNFATDILDEGVTVSSFNVGQDGNLAVATTGGMIYLLDTQGNVLAQFGEGLPDVSETAPLEMGYFFAPRDMEQLSNGDWIVLDSSGDYVQLLRMSFDSEE